MFTPSGAHSLKHKAPLVVALHGCTQTASDFAAGTRLDAVAVRFGAYVLYPEQTAAANAQRCWNWFRTSDQFRAAGEPAEIIALVNETMERFPIDRERVFVVGLSAGGAMAAILAEQAPDIFSAAGIMAGVRLHASDTIAQAHGAMRGAYPELGVPLGRGNGYAGAYDRLRLSLWTGVDDNVVAPINTALLAHQFAGLLGLSRDAVEEQRPDADILRWRDAAGRTRIEAWSVPKLGHAWSGGSFRGSYTSASGPRASDEMMAFFLDTALVR